MKATLVLYLDLNAQNPYMWFSLAKEIIQHIEKFCDHYGYPVSVIHAETLDHGDVDEEDHP